MKKIAIIENEPYWLEQLTDLLFQWSSINESIEVHTFQSGEEIVNQYANKQENYDVIFVDIELGDMNGLEAIRRLRSTGLESEVVITTNHHELNFIQESFFLSALQYYIKPLTLENITVCLSKARKKKHFIVEHSGVLQRIPFKEILYFESARNYIETHFLSQMTKPKEFRGAIAQLATTLPLEFVQNHRSFIVNISHVIKIEERMLHLRNGVILPMGKSFIDDVLHAFQKQN